MRYKLSIKYEYSFIFQDMAWLLSSSVVLHHVVEGLLQLVVDGLALLLLADELVLELVDLQVDPLHVHLAVLRPALRVLGENKVF